MTINDVFWHNVMAPDERLGRVDEDGRVYETRFGPDRYVGRVNLENGQIYEARMGPDKHVGRIDLNTGKIYLKRFGPDDYTGRVEVNGRMFYHRPLQRDPYMGRVKEMSSFAHGGAAFVLLVLPRLEQEVEGKE